MIERFSPQARKPDLSEDDKKEQMLIAHIRERGYAANQVEEAYVLAMGSDETPAEDPGTEDIRKMLRSMIDDGFPVNRIGALIQSKRRFENAKEQCISFIDHLNVSENEKRMLASIVDGRRNGELIVMIDNQTVATMKIHIPDEVLVEAFALEFQDRLEEIVANIPKEKRYEFSFTEN